MTRKFTAGLVAAAMAAGSLVPEQAQARDSAEIYRPIFAQYKSITDARKKLRNKEKKGQAMSGDEYFAMAHACMYEEPASQSMILTALSRSRCKDKVGDYFVEAGMRGTPEGFLSAARTIGTGQGAYTYAQLAYQLAGNDDALRQDALDLMDRLRNSASNLAQANATAEGMATQLVSSGVYPGLRNAAGEAELSNRLPNLSWLAFKNPKRCHWSDAAQNVLQNSMAFDDSRNMFPTVPANVRVPGVERPVRSRVERPDKEYQDIVHVSVDFKGRWNGLTVLGLTHLFLEESDGLQGTGIRFAEPLDEVVGVLLRNGFVVNRDGSTREQIDKRDRDGNIDGVITVVERKNGETVFYCDEVYYASYGA